MPTVCHGRRKWQLHSVQSERHMKLFLKERAEDRRVSLEGLSDVGAGLGIDREI
jgi:hypothetical protein